MLAVCYSVAAMDKITTADTWKLRHKLCDVYKAEQWRNIVWYLNESGKLTQIPTTVATLFSRIRSFYCENPHALIMVNTWDTLWGKESLNVALKTIIVQVEWISYRKLFTRQALQPVTAATVAAAGRAMNLMEKIAQLRDLVMLSVDCDIDFGKRALGADELCVDFVRITELELRAQSLDCPELAPSPALVQGLERVRSCALHALQVQLGARAEALARVTLIELSRHVNGPSWQAGESALAYAQRVCQAASFRVLLFDDLAAILPAITSHPALRALKLWLAGVESLRKELRDPCSESNRRYLSILDSWQAGGSPPWELDAADDPVLSFRCSAWQPIHEPPQDLDAAESLEAQLGAWGALTDSVAPTANPILNLERLPPRQRALRWAFWRDTWQKRVMCAAKPDMDAAAPDLPLDLASQPVRWDAKERLDFLQADLRFLFSARIVRDAELSLLTAVSNAQNSGSALLLVEAMLETYPADPRVYPNIELLRKLLQEWVACVSKLSSEQSAKWQEEFASLEDYLEARMRHYRKEHQRLEREAIGLLQDPFAGQDPSSAECRLAYGDLTLNVHRDALYRVAAKEQSPLYSWHWQHHSCYHFDKGEGCAVMGAQGALMSPVLLRALVYWFYHGDLPGAVARTYGKQLDTLFAWIFPSPKQRGWREVL